MKSGDAGGGACLNSVEEAANTAINSEESADPDPSSEPVATQVYKKKDKKSPKKRKGEAEKLLEDCKGRTTRRATAKDKVPLHSQVELSV
jgi:hypothetical protein